jgi:redox-sensitive bicupin YhaK (pirin superfamily)
MSVAAHLHAGLQTVSWLFTGEIEHRDSLGSVQKVAPGELNLMTAGRGIAHSELSISNSTPLHGVQLWTVLPDQYRGMEPSFDHYNNLPIFDWKGMSIRLFVGEFHGKTSPAKIFSPMIAAEIDLPVGSMTSVPADLSFEYGVLVVSGHVEVNGNLVRVGQLHYVPEGKREIVLASASGAKPESALSCLP